MAKKVTRIEPDPQLALLEKVGIYCRVSSSTPAQIHSLSSQASYLLKYALNHRGWRVADIYIDIGSGSTADKRPEFMRMLSDVESGKLTKIITKSVSRFGRNAEEILEAYHEIVARGASVYFEGQDLDSWLPDCELYISLYGGIAQEENRQLSENIKWGIRKRAADGTSAIYDRPCYGYRVNKDGKFEIVPDEASVVREIFSMYIRGLSIVKIKQSLESVEIPSPTGKPNWSKHTIDTILKNKKYVGSSEVYKTFMDGYPQSKRKTNAGEHNVYEMKDHHIPIIPMEVFAAAQKARAARTNIEVDENGSTRRKATKYSAARARNDEET